MIKIKQEKERNKSANNIKGIKSDNYLNDNSDKLTSYEDKIKLKILQRSLDQQRAIEHLRGILYPEKQLLIESEYQGFNKEKTEKNQIKQREYNLADEARKIQIEKMKKLLDYSISDKKRRKKEEIKMDRKYREFLDRDHELYLEKENMKKYEKAEKMENYRKMLDEQIIEKNEMLLDDNNLSESNKDYAFMEY